jgi:hypothetical protein
MKRRAVKPVTSRSGFDQILLTAHLRVVRADDPTVRQAA